jgi:aspartyl-tRNA(Asn)/glutamyl-tRNA(Gln) amidotransferase subunit C
MTITPDEVRHIATLARLQLTDDEVKRFTAELSTIVDYVEQMNALDTTGVIPRTVATTSTDMLREDEVKPFGDRQQILDNAPKKLGDQWQVPGVLG